MMVALLGYGKTTKAIAQKFKDNTFVFFDDKVTDSYIDSSGFRVQASSSYLSSEFDLSIPSPGVPPHNKLITSSSNLVSEYDFILNEQRTVWITGTNGKTTTTQMLQLLLIDQGAVSGGNIGTPLADLDSKAPLWILETSSFTMHYTTQSAPDILVILPITPDHIDWHGDEDSYVKDKLSAIDRMQEGELAIVPKKYANFIGSSRAFIVTYENSEDIANYFEIDISKVEFEGVFLLDALLALAVAKVLYGVCDYDRLNRFILESHRQEMLTDHLGRVWINDSKATNIDAAAAAIERFKDRRLHVIIGGDTKGIDLSDLFRLISSVDALVYLIGEDRQILVELSKHFQIRYQISHTIQNAVKSIDLVLDKHSVALLSPASASFDQYRSYVERGDDFKQSVEALSRA